MDVRSISWVEYSETRERITLVIIPVGAVEAYGPHLPLGTDGLVVERIAQLLAEKVPAFVAPVVSVGYSKSFDAFPGTLTVSPSALEEYVGGLAESFVRHGARRILFLNGHAGNVAPLGFLMDRLEIQHQVHCAQVDFWRYIQPLVSSFMEDTVRPFGHASEAMTSIMLFLMPEKVHLERLNPPFPVSPLPAPGLMIPRWPSPPQSIAVSGNPGLGTAEKGGQIVDAILAALVEFTRTWE